MRRLGLVAAAFIGLSQEAVGEIPTPVTIQAIDPRPFGYVIGDVVERQISVQVAAPYAIVKESLPRPRRIDNWLELRAVKVEQHRELYASRYDVRLTYQIMNVSEEVRTIALPAVSMQFQGAATRLEQSVAEWPITVAPITPTYVLARAGLEELRPDAVPMPLDAHVYQLRLGAYAVALCSIMFYWLARRFGQPFVSRSRRPFARALRDLRGLTRSPNDANTCQAALRRVHRAFDETTGHVLFAEQLDQFFIEHPRFADLRARVAQFFEVSQQEFFGSGAPRECTPDFLLDFCRQCRDRERALA